MVRSECRAGSLAACAALLFAFGSTRSASAQEAGRAPFALLGPEQGVPSTGVLGIAQDESGFLWFGTEGGLVRYEGGQHRRFAAPDGLPSAYVGSVARVGPDIWAATLRGVARFHDGKVEVARIAGAPSGENTVFVAGDRTGRAWATSGAQLLRQRDGLDLEVVPVGQGHVRAVAAAGKWDGVWASTQDEVLAVGATGVLKRYGAAEGVPANVEVLAEDGQGRLWAAARRSLALLEPGAARFTDQTHRLPGQISPVPSAFVDRDGSLWLPTQVGALHLGSGGDELLDSAAGLPFRWVRAIFRDREGSLWVAGAGLARMQGEGRVRSHPISADGAGVVVWSMARDRAGRLLVGSDDGAARLGKAGLERIPGTEGQRVKGILEDREGTVWMVSSIIPALRLRPGHERAEPAPFGELAKPIGSVLEDSQGRLWFGHASRGVLRWDRQAQRLIEETPQALTGLRNFEVLGLREDREGRIWAASTAGLLVRETTGVWRAFSTLDGFGVLRLRDLAPLPDGTAWLASTEPLGLVRVLLREGKLELLEHRLVGSGLRSDLVYAVRADSRGRVWSTSDQGLDRLYPPLHIGRHEGMPSEDCSLLGLLVEDGAVWVGHAAGLTRYDASGIEAPAPPPQTFLLSAEVRGQRFEPPFGVLPALPASDSSVELRLASPSYVNEHDLRFQVRTVGLEDGWRDTSSRLVRYPALPPGAYRFEAHAASGTGPFGPAASLDLVVLRPWWQTWWATALGLLAIAGIASGLAMLRVASLARAKLELEALVATRTGELQARNEELSAALSEVKELSGLLPICMHCSKVRNDSGYWQKIEQYISLHTKANFSHGLCPECYTKHYPE